MMAVGDRHARGRKAAAWLAAKGSEAPILVPRDRRRGQCVNFLHEIMENHEHRTHRSSPHIGPPPLPACLGSVVCPRSVCCLLIIRIDRREATSRVDGKRETNMSLRDVAAERRYATPTRANENCNANTQRTTKASYVQE